jgi:hypothetical protein
MRSSVAQGKLGYEIANVLERTLRRQEVRRNQIYNLFLDDFLQLGARKATSGFR